MLEDQPFHNLQSNWDFNSCQIQNEPSNSKRPPDPSNLEEDEHEVKRNKRSPQHPHTPDIEENPSREKCMDSQYNSNSLINPIGRDLSITCLLRVSRSDYNSVASLSRNFRNLVRTGELYRLRRQAGISEHWVYFSCNVLEWDAYDIYRHRWLTLPRMPPNECFMCSDKESLAVGTELLVFGKGVGSLIVLRYSILTNSWTTGVVMNQPRCLFGSASLGEKAIIAGGTDPNGNILGSAEMYNSETHVWTTLPSMNRPRKKCSGVFMDGKFYVIGGMASNTEVLTCGEEYDPEKGTWRVIPNMSLGLNGASGAPPLVAVVNNELYAADYGEKEVRKYDKERNEWITLGSLPERSVSMNGWGLAFRACGERLIVIGGPRSVGGGGGGVIELNSCVPGAGPPEWVIIARRPSGSFVYNCAIMGC